MSTPHVPGEAEPAGIDPDNPSSVRAALADLDEASLRDLEREASHLVDDDDVTREPQDPEGSAGRWRVDPLPLVVGADQWASLQAGIVQRTELLDLVLTDLYGPRDLVRTQVLPPEVVFGHPGFLRALDQVRRPGPHQLATSSTDLVRDAQGTWLAIADHTDVPTGLAYALENRSVLSRLLPEVHRAAHVVRPAPYLRALRSALRAAAPADVDEPRIAVLAGDARRAFEHGSLAGLLGHPVVEGPDMSVRDGRLWLRSLGGHPVRIDVLLRRIRSWSCDPLELRSDSTVGTPGLVEVARRGGVGVVNPLGAGALENPALQAHLDDVASALLGQDLRLPGPPTWWCGDPDGLAEVRSRLDDLVLRPLGAGGDAVETRRLTTAAREELDTRLVAAPHRWVGQVRVEGRGERSLARDGTVVEAPVVLRTFAVTHGQGYEVLPGGLGRVAPSGAPPGDVWSKDVWVLGGGREATGDFWLHRGPAVAAESPESVVSSRTVENLLWLGRYLERAEATVRLLRVVDERRGEAGGGAAALGHVVDHLLVAVTETTRTRPGFHDPDRRGAPDAELTALVLDGAREGTLAFAVRRLLDAARAVRDQLSGDAWPVLTALERQVLGEDGAAVLAGGTRGSAHGRGALSPVLTLLLALHGVATESLVRDPSWRFLEAGRRLERGQQLLGLLRTTVTQLGDEDTAEASAATSLLLESVLVACESVITYRRRYRSRAQLSTALELLLRDPGNPRSLQWQLDRLLEVLPDLADGDSGQPSPTTDAVRAAATSLRTADLEGLGGSQLETLLEQLDVQLRRAGSELARTVLAPAPRPRPMVDGRAADGDLT